LNRIARIWTGWVTLVAFLPLVMPVCPVLALVGACPHHSHSETVKHPPKCSCCEHAPRSSESETPKPPERCPLCPLDCPLGTICFACAIYISHDPPITIEPLIGVTFDPRPLVLDAPEAPPLSMLRPPRA